MDQNKRNQIPLQDKYEIIKLIDSGAKSCDIIEKFKLKNKSTLSTIKKMKDTIISNYEQNRFTSKRKKFKCSAYPKLEEQLKKWIVFVWKNTIPLTGPIIKEKAKEYAQLSGINDFEASDGWLANFRSRNEILFQKIQGESASVNQDTVNEWMTVKLP
jgi:hypothetical protein